MNRRDALVRVIDLLHAEIAALKANDLNALERATAHKLTAIETLRALGDGPERQSVPVPTRELAHQAGAGRHDPVPGLLGPLSTGGAVVRAFRLR